MLTPAERRVRFQLRPGDFIIDVRTYYEEDWADAQELLKAMAVGVKRAKGTITVFTSHETEEAL